MGDNWWKYLLAFALGLTAGIVVCKSHSQLRNVCTRAIGGAMHRQDMPAENAADIGEASEALIADA